MNSCLLQTVAATCNPGAILRCLLLTCVCWFAALLPVVAHAAQDTLIQVGHMPGTPLALAENVTLLEDPGQNLTLIDVLQPANASRFMPPPAAARDAAGLNFGLSGSAIWLRMQLSNDSFEDVETVLELANPALTTVQLFHVDGTMPMIDTGAARPFSTRPFANRFFVLPLVVHANSRQILLLRVTSAAALALPLRLWRGDAYPARQRSDYACQGWFFGIVVALAIYNLLLFSNLRDPIYLWYVVFAFAGGLAMAAHQGLGAEFLWPGSTHWNHAATLVCSSLAGVGLAQLMRTMLGTTLLTPRLNQLLQLVILIQLALPVFVLVSFRHALLPLLALHSITAGLLLASSLICVVRHQRNACFFSIALLALGVPLALNTLHSLYPLAASTNFQPFLQPGAAVCLLLLAFALVDRVNLMRHEKDRARQQSIAAQQKRVENLRHSESTLEQRVNQRTTDLMQSHAALCNTHDQLFAAYQLAEHAREIAEQAQAQASHSLDELCAAQVQLVQLEKMAALGQLIAGIAHEINTPIGAVKSSGRTIADTLNPALRNLVRLFQTLDQARLILFFDLLNQALLPHKRRSTRDDRSLTREIGRQLQQHNVPETQSMAGMLVQLNAFSRWQDYLPLLQSAHARLILQSANTMAIVLSCSNNINSTVERMDNIIVAMNSFSDTTHDCKMQPCDLRDSMETVLQRAQKQLPPEVEIVRNYQAAATVRCAEEQMHQVWQHLIHNALQAMRRQGQLSISMQQQGDEVAIAISDTGCGMPDSVREHIFDAFFTTRAAGEGSGLGMAIVRNIILRHQGRISVESAVGMGTTVRIHLPCQTGAAALTEAA